MRATSSQRLLVGKGGASKGCEFRVAALLKGSGDLLACKWAISEVTLLITTIHSQLRYFRVLRVWEETSSFSGAVVLFLFAWPACCWYASSFQP